MRIVVFGATGNVGTSLLDALARDERVDFVLGVARRVPAARAAGKVEWARADITTDALAPVVEGADAVVHLAWAIQPSRDEPALRAVNIGGSARVFDAVARAGVPVLVHASSVGAYSAGPKDEPVDESWPLDGVQTLFYARHKAEAERLLNRFEHEHPEVRTVRLRPALIFKRESGTEQRRLFAGPLIPAFLVRPDLIPFVPDAPRLRFQAVHTDDVARAYCLAVMRDVRGAFNIAADPVLDADRLARLLRARRLPAPGFLRGVAAFTWLLLSAAQAGATSPAALAGGLGGHGIRGADHGYDPRARGARMGAAKDVRGRVSRAARGHAGRREAGYYAGARRGQALGLVLGP